MALLFHYLFSANNNLQSGDKKSVCLRVRLRHDRGDCDFFCGSMDIGEKELKSKTKQTYPSLIELSFFNSVKLS